MFGRHIPKGEEEITFPLTDHLKIFLECIKAPHASHLILMHDENKLIDVSVSYENSQRIKKAMRDKRCTNEGFIALLHELNLSKFVTEVEHEMRIPPSPSH